MSASSTAISLPVAHRRRRSIPRTAVVVGVVSVAAALIGSYVGSNLWTSLRQRGLERRFDAAALAWERMDPAARSAVEYAPGDPVARLVISSIGLDAIVAEGATPAIMRSAPGHLSSSATPGENGVAIVLANRMGFGSFFLRLDRLTVGDQIVTESAIGKTVYEVESVRIVPSEELDLDVDSTSRVLVLFGSARLWGGPDRLVVRALAIEGRTP